MSAKEMFKTLGYKKYNKKISGVSISYFKDKENEDILWIWFYNNKYIEVLHDISVEELQAINKQVEELGWNNEVIPTSN